MPTNEKPSARNAAIAACIAAVATSALVAHNAPEFGGDFSVYWAALRDGNPYARGLMYPLPTLLILLPLRWLSVHDGAVAFNGYSLDTTGIPITAGPGAQTQSAVAANGELGVADAAMGVGIFHRDRVHGQWASFCGQKSVFRPGAEYS